MRSLAFAVALLATIHWQNVEIIRDRALAHGVSPDVLVAVARCETGGTFNPTSVGDSGSSLGLFQLHRRGLLPHFYRVGYDDPFDPWLASDYAARAFAGEWRHLGIGPSHWTCYRNL